MAWSRKASEGEVLDDPLSKDERKRHCQSGQYWNRSLRNVGKTSERRSGAHMGFSERIDTILNLANTRR